MTTTQTWAEWLDSQPDDALPTHRVRLRIEVDVAVLLHPSTRTYQGHAAVVAAAKRMDPNDVLAGIDYETDQFLPAGATLVAVHADIEKIP